MERLSIQKGVSVDINIVPGANHFLTDHLEPMITHVWGYLDTAVVTPALIRWRNPFYHQPSASPLITLSDRT